jgi:hypothetical protein
MVNPIIGRILSHRRNVLKFVEQIFIEVYLQIIELLDTLTLVHISRVE